CLHGPGLRWQPEADGLCVSVVVGHAALTTSGRRKDAGEFLFPRHPCSNVANVGAMSALWRLHRTNIAGGGAPRPYVPDGHRALALDLGGAPRLAVEAVGDALVGALGDLHGAGRAVRLHAAGDVDGVAPQVVQEPLLPDDPGDHRAGVDPDPEAQAASPEHARLDQLLEAQPELRDGDRMVRPRIRHAGGDHVAIADRLDLLEAELVDERVERGEDLVQQGDGLRGT